MDRNCEMFSLYWWTKHCAWFEKRKEEKSPKRGWTFGERMSPSCSGMSRPGIQAEKDKQTIWDLHVAIKRRNPLKGGNKRWWGSPRQWCTWSSRRLLVQKCAGSSLLWDDDIHIHLGLNPRSLLAAWHSRGWKRKSGVMAAGTIPMTFCHWYIIAWSKRFFEMRICWG